MQATCALTGRSYGIPTPIIGETVVERLVNVSDEMAEIDQGDSAQVIRQEFRS
jgi:hypothetical protein